VIAECREEIELAGDSSWAAAPLVCCAFVMFASGRLWEAQAQATAAEMIARKHGNGDLASVAARVRDLLRLGDTEVSSDRYHSDIDHREPSLLLTVPGMGPALVRAALGVGDRERACRIVVAIECVAAENFGLPALDAAARHARGQVEADAGMLREAAIEHRHPLARASACEDAGVVLAVCDPEAAQVEFERALDAYELSGADRAAGRVRTRLHDLWTSGPSRRRTRPRWGWVSLTQTEARVARLVADGLTNAKVAERMFLSRHTIDFHLRQIYRKLGIGSRVELTRLVLEHAA
jgi:DNA-binding CsgD family transcriptional regulator